MATKKCPVCDWAIEDGGERVEVDGETIVVCCDDCATKVQANPERYLKPR